MAKKKNQQQFKSFKPQQFNPTQVNLPGTPAPRGGRVARVNEYVGRAKNATVGRAGAVWGHTKEFAGTTGAAARKFGGQTAGTLGASPKMGGMAGSLAEKAGRRLHGAGMNVQTFGKNMFNITPRSGRLASAARSVGGTLMSSAPKIAAGVTKYGRLGAAGVGAAGLGVGIAAIRRSMKKRKIRNQMAEVRAARG